MRSLTRPNPVQTAGLRAQYADAYLVVRQALRAVEHTGPHARDYQTYEIGRATAEHQRRLARLARVQRELGILIDACELKEGE